MNIAAQCRAHWCVFEDSSMAHTCTRLGNLASARLLHGTRGTVREPPSHPCAWRYSGCSGSGTARAIGVRLPCEDRAAARARLSGRRPHDRPLLRRSCGQVAVAAASAAVPRIDDCTGRSARWRSVRRTAAAARWVRSKFPTTRLSRGAATGAPQPRCENLDFRSFGADPTVQKRGHSPPNGTRDGRRYEKATLRRLSTSPRLSADDAEATRRYPPGSIGSAFQVYIRTPEWAARALSARSKVWWPAWFRIRDMWGDVAPDTITFE